MDPEAVMRRLRLAFQGKDREEIGEAADALIGWLEREGFMPSDLLAQGLNRRQALYYLRGIRAVAEML